MSKSKSAKSRGYGSSFALKYTELPSGNVVYDPIRKQTMASDLPMDLLQSEFDKTVKFYFWLRKTCPQYKMKSSIIEFFLFCHSEGKDTFDRFFSEGVFDLGNRSFDASKDVLH